MALAPSPETDGCLQAGLQSELGMGVGALKSLAAFRCSRGTGKKLAAHNCWPDVSIL